MKEEKSVHLMEFFGHIFNSSWLERERHVRDMIDIEAGLAVAGAAIASINGRFSTEND